MRSGEWNQGGFTYLAVLFALMLMALASTAVMQYVSQQVQREREDELLTIGQEFVQAISTYYVASPGTVKNLPKELTDLLDDKRQVGIKRHLREVRLDPFTGKPEWDVVRASDGGIVGVRSRGSAKPIREGNVFIDAVLASSSGAGGAVQYKPTVITLLPAARYSEWAFTFNPPSMPPPGFHK